MTEATRALPPESPAGAAQARQFNLRTFIGRFGALIFLLALVIVFSILKPNSFPTPVNLFNIARQASIYGLIAVGMTFVILTGGIDLSVGSLLALAGIVAAYLYKGGTLLSAGAGETTGIGVGGAILVASLVGLIGGFLQGFVITRFKIPPFIVTMGGMSAFRGLALLVGNGGPISAFDDNFKLLGQGKILGDVIPIPVLIFIAVAVVAFIVLRYTQYGRYVYAVGGNPEAARLAGLNTRLIMISVYMIVGLLAGFAGFMLSSRLNSAEVIAGAGAELTVIASVVIGGTSLVGGEGGVFGTFIGSLLISVLTAGLTQLNVSSYIQQIIIGLVIIFAVLFDRFTKARRN